MIISPSLLSADFAVLKEELEKIKEGGATWVHYDVMDGHFVPNISFGYSILGNVRKVTDLFLDVHLMISDPLKYVDEFIKNGADLITFHIEAYENEDTIKATIKKIKDANIKVGLSIKPNTAVETLKPYIKDLDLVLVMSVEPGFGGQSFIEATPDKIKAIKTMIVENQLDTLIEVDGGINATTGASCKDAGVDVLVAGSYVFNNDNYQEAINSLL